VSKTTILGILTIIGGVLLAIAEAFGHPVDQNMQQTIRSVVVVLVTTFFPGVGLIAARDAKPSDKPDNPLVY
jgi:drug/metabolite transporter (DMT)-like permease